MRLDKYLKVSRLIKRRTVAQSACEGGHVLVNGKPQKSAYTVKVGDMVSVVFGQKPLTVRVTSLEESVRREDAQGMYEVVDQL